eukprot:scaffold10326_cov164-Amphora_coffeaeformis.AAC.2
MALSKQTRYHPHHLYGTPYDTFNPSLLCHISLLMPRKGLKRGRASTSGPKKIAVKDKHDDDDAVEDDIGEDTAAPFVFASPSSDLPDNEKNSADNIEDDTDNMEDDDDEEEDERLKSDSPSFDNKEPTAPPPAKFQPMEKVIARDNDGVMYDAVIRRALYGRGQVESIQLGFCSHAEAQLLQEQQGEDEPPCWHYFIHYNQWNSKWDRWVREYDVYPANEAIKQYAARVVEAHKQLRTDMAKKVKGKKSFQTIDGSKFLQEWRKCLNAIDAELKINNPRFDTAAAIQQAKKKKNEKKSGMSKAAMLEERKLRGRGLTKRSKESAANMIQFPSGLKRALVEQWELITQCDMLTDLPASVTVRDALDAYLRSKGVDPELCHSSPNKNGVNTTSVAVKKETTSELSKEETQEASDKDTTKHETEQAEDTIKVDETKENSNDPTASTEITSSMDIDNPSPEAPGNPPAPPSTSFQPNTDQDQSEISEEVQGWLDMANGIAQFFDDALPYRLLYREEYPQLRVVQRTEALSDKAYSEIYGCEHLLRMFTRLPDLLVQDLTPEEYKPIFAKLNDFARFLHKNQSSYLAASHRKPNGDEQVEAFRMEARQQKKKMRDESMTKKAKKDATISPVQT